MDKYMFAVYTSKLSSYHNHMHEDMYSYAALLIIITITSRHLVHPLHICEVSCFLNQ